MPAMAQVTVSLGTYTGSASTNALLSTSTTINRYSRTISLYTASEIIAAGGTAGDITSLAWDKYGTGEYTFGDAYIKIYMKHTSNNVWNSSPVPDWDTEINDATEVFTVSTYSIPTGTGWKEVPFDNPFYWNGTDNIAICVEWYRPGMLSSDINWGHSSDNMTNATRVGSTSLEDLDFLINANRPLVRLTFNGVTWDPITDLTVQTENNVPASIAIDDGTLQMEAIVLPATANPNVTWSIVPVTGSASINPSGLVTAFADGTVWAKATSVQDATIKDSLLITISNQIILIDSIVVATQNNVPAVITTDGGTLQMEAIIFPANANQAVSWTIVPGTGNASINGSGLVAAQSDGTVWAKAVSIQNPTLSDSLEITISNQNPGNIDSIVITTAGNVPAEITVPNGTLGLQATVFPSSASQNVSWSIVSVSGAATIASNGVVTAVSNGTVYAIAVAVADPTAQDSLLVTISGQNTGIGNLISGKALRLFPNPAKNLITLAVPESVFKPGATVRIIDIRGKVLREVKAATSQSQFDIAALPAGNYLLIYQQNTDRATIGFSVVK